MDQKRMITIHLVCSIVLVLCAAALGGAPAALSATAGAVIVGLSVGFMTWSMRRFFEKKSIALAGTVIVIKYLLLGVALYWITKQPWAQLGWLALGVGSVVFTAVFYSLTTKDLVTENPLEKVNQSS